MTTLFIEPQPQSQVASLRGIASALEALRDQTGNEKMTLPQIMILLAVGIKTDVPQSDLEAVTQLTGAGVSRILFDQMGPGRMNLVTTRKDSENRRKSIVSLTSQGRRAVSAMLMPVQTRSGSPEGSNCEINKRN